MKKKRFRKLLMGMGVQRNSLEHICDSVKNHNKRRFTRFHRIFTYDSLYYNFRWMIERGYKLSKDGRHWEP